MAGPHVFEDGRIGVWNVSLANLVDRLPKFKAFQHGSITDVFLPSAATAADAKKVRDGGLFVGQWWSVDGLSAEDYAKRALADIKRTTCGAGDLNLEMGDDVKLAAFIRRAVGLLRQSRPGFKFRINIAPRKGVFLPRDLILTDSNLYACEQNYFGNMEQRFSEAEALQDLLDAGVPIRKAAICYGAACEVGGVTKKQRVNILPNFPVHGIRRGVIFTDDLLVEAGLL